MNKLIVAVVAICTAALASAATYNWNASSCWVSADGENPLEGTAYLYDANAFSSSAIMAALDKNDTTVLSSALGSSAIDGDGAFEASGSGLTDNGGSPAYANMFAIIVANDGSADYYYNAGTLNQKITDAVLASEAKFAFGGDDGIETGAIGGAGWAKVGGGGSGDVPEPTSGLLLLLGVAGLALRRKQA